MNLSIPDMARRLGTTVERVQQWEGGERRPTVRQARLWAKATRHSLALLYLPEPPRGFKPIRDFRRLPGLGGQQRLSPELAYQIHSAELRRELALDFLEEAEETPEVFDFRLRISSDTEVSGGRIREFLGVTARDQREWSGKYMPLHGWRDAMQARGVLVFQSTRVDLEEMRGFSLPGDQLPVITLNPQDTPAGRVFTLLHEFAHLGLRQGGLCDLEGENRTEVFCNAVAAAALVPRGDLEDQTIGMSGDHFWDEDELRRLARMFSVSREVVLRRLVTLGRASQAFYRQKRSEWLAQYAKARQRRKEKRTPIPAYRLAVSQLGAPFLSLALRSYWDQRLSLSELASVAGVQVRDIPKIQAEVVGNA